MNSMGDDLAFAPAWQVREQIASKEISPLELVDLFLDRIETLNPKLNAYLRVTSEEARIQAAAAEKAVIRGDELGLLHGVPVSIKDLEATKGIPTTFGSAVFKGYVPNEDSLVVERIRQAGAIVLGKSNTPEFGLSGANENLLGDACRNPWNPGRTSGGSSGGAGAALAAGLCSLASGSDGGGSIRIPSSFCGVFGIKPTQWRVPRYGGVRDAKPPANQFSQSGSMARSVKDAAILLQILSGYDSRGPLSLRGEVPDFVSGLESGVREFRLGWSPDFGYSAVDPEVVELTSAAAMRFEQLGCEVEEARVDLEDPFPAFLDHVLHHLLYRLWLPSRRTCRGAHRLYPIRHGAGHADDRRRLLQGLVYGPYHSSQVQRLAEEVRPAAEPHNGYCGIPRGTVP